MLASTAEPPHTTVYLACRVHFPGLGEEEGRYFTYKDSEQTEEGVGWGLSQSPVPNLNIPTCRSVARDSRSSASCVNKARITHEPFPFQPIYIYTLLFFLFDELLLICQSPTKIALLCDTFPDCQGGCLSLHCDPTSSVNAC